MLTFRMAMVLLVAPVLTLTGCGDAKKEDDKKPAAHADDHGHGHEGPHGGHIIELSDAYHAELTHDDASKTITVYILDGKAEKNVAIAATELPLNLVVDGKPLQVKLAAAPEEGEAEGTASKFTVVDEAALEALESEKTTGRLIVEIDGKSYNGKLEHHDHDH
jgi:hypothetical protein